MDHGSLLKIAKLLNGNNIRWALGASYSLFFYDLVEKPRDIDIFIDKKDIHRAIKELSKIAQLENEPPKGQYLTEFFYYFTYENTEIDIISNFKFKHDNGVFEHEFSEKTIMDSVLIDSVNIPIMAIEDWYILYLVMSNKKGRGDLTEAYLKEHGIKYPEFIKKALNQPLPKDVDKRVKKIIKI